MIAEKLRVGIIGMGLFAAYEYVPGFQKLDQVELTAISRRDAERLAIAQSTYAIPYAYTDWREMLDKASLDAVVVCTPHHLHTAPTVAALERGLHVVVEKPMTLSSQDARRMAQAAAKAGRILMIGYPNQLNGLWRTVKELIATNTLGQIRQINRSISHYRRWFWDPEQIPPDVQTIFKDLADMTGLPEAFFADWGHAWHHLPAEMGGGSFADLGTHHLDLMLWLAGAPVVEVMAMTEKAGMPVDCFINVQARLANGVLFSMTSADAVPQPLLHERALLMIVGDEGVLTQTANQEIWLYRDGEHKQVEAKYETRTKAETFVAAILAGDEDYPHADEGVHVVDMMEAIYRSAAENRLVRIDEIRSTSK
jgi:predicted dehydrogenase